MNFNPTPSDRKNIFLSLISGIMLTAAFPKTGCNLLAFFAFIPLLFALRDSSEKKALFCGLIFGLSHFFTLLIWVIHTLKIYGFLPLWLCIPILLLLAFYLSLYSAVFSWLVSRFCKNPAQLIIIAPPLWVCLEIIRSILFTGFPWELLGYSQYKFLHFIQIADITGVYGISFFIVLVNISLFQALLMIAKKTWQNQKTAKKNVLLSLSATTLSILMIISYGFYKIHAIDKLANLSKKAGVSVIQGNIDQSLKWKKRYQLKTIEKYNKLSYLASAEKPDLIIWPETAAPFYYIYNKKLSKKVISGIKKTGAAHIIGSPSFIKKKNGFVFFNSAYITSPDGKTFDKYDKIHLVPFGEYVPLKKFLPFIHKLTEQTGNFLPGKKGKIIEYRDMKLGIQICFEVVFPKLSRAAVKNGANLIINMTNDAWFGKKSAPFQHFSMVVYRAIENRRAVARAANTGISGFIDPVGRQVSTTDLYVDAHLSEELPLLETQSFYTSFGDVFAWLCFLVFPFVFFSGKMRKN